MNEKSFAFLGQYLVANDLVSQDQLDEAIQLQKENNALVGTIALDQGFLDNDQLNYLISRQTEIDERIGKLAVREGFMSDDQLSTVLSIQGENHVFLGESLVRLGTISHEVLTEALNRFEAQILAQEREVREVISHLPAAREVLITLDVALRFFYRLGYAVRVTGMDQRLPDDFDSLYCCEQIFHRKYIGYVGIGMTSLLVRSIVQNIRTNRRANDPDTHAMENMSELVFNLNCLACREMKNRGLNAKHGAAFIGLPPAQCENDILIEMQTVTNPMALTYSH